MNEQPDADDIQGWVDRAMDRPEKSPVSPEEIERIVAEHLRVTVPIHKRRCAIKHGVRESSELEADCDHVKHWNPVKRWCENCGITLHELWMQKQGTP